jgi:ppGpp synthetase/RelA/SpoT-type nucleotidyltranferase
MSVIDSFVHQYNKEYDYYQKLAQIVSGRIEDQLFKRGIKAIVSFRAKKPDRLREKLTKRDETKRYKTVADITGDIVDLAGVRVSLYFPSEREVLDEVISDSFVIEQKKEFPDASFKPKLAKRFSGYWATHYRVKLKPEVSVKRYSDTLVEIQVASVLMHAWSEVEHDLVYKPFSGNLSKEELAILDEINGLVLSGEIALERLHAAMADRTKSKRSITDRYELTNLLTSYFADQFSDKVKLGDTYLLNNLLASSEHFNTRNINRHISKIDTKSDESVSEQLLYMLLSDAFEADTTDIGKYFRNLQLPERKASMFERFVKYWIILEKATREFLAAEQTKVKKYLVPELNVLLQRQIISQHEADDLAILRKKRNQLLHGIEEPADVSLKLDVDLLKKIVAKVIYQVPDGAKRNELVTEFEAV